MRRSTCFAYRAKAVRHGLSVSPNGGGPFGLWPCMSESRLFARVPQVLRLAGQLRVHAKKHVFCLSGEGCPTWSQRQPERRRTFWFVAMHERISPLRPGAAGATAGRPATSPCEEARVLLIGRRLSDMVSASARTAADLLVCGHA